MVALQLPSMSYFSDHLIFTPWDFFVGFCAISRLCESSKGPIKIKVLYREGVANITHAMMLSVRQTPANVLLSVWEILRLVWGDVTNPISFSKLIKQLLECT